jgi:hypothetical protein
MDLIQYRPQPLTLYGQQGLNGGLNGFWGSLARGIVGVVGGIVGTAAGECPLIGGYLQGQVARFTVYIQGQIPAEEAKINQWANRYKVWIKRIVLEIEAAAAKSTIPERIAAINIVVNKMNAVADHYANYDTDGLSETGIMSRDTIIAQTMEPLRETVKEFLSKLPGTVTTIVVTFNPNNYNPYTLLFNTTPLTAVTGDNYVFSTGTSTGSGTTAGGTTSTGTGTTAGGTTTVGGTAATTGTTTGGGKGTITLPGATTPVVTPVATTPTTVATPVGKTAEPAPTASNTGKIVAALGLAAAAYWAFSESAKKTGLKRPARKVAKRRRK